MLEEKRIILIEDAQKQSSLSDDEFKVSLGVLKRKSFIELKNKKIILSANKGELSKKTDEEIFIEFLPLDFDSMSDEKKEVMKSLQNRKDIIRIKEEKIPRVEVTELGKQLMKSNVKESNLIEQITPGILKKDSLQPQ